MSAAANRARRSAAAVLRVLAPAADGGKLRWMRLDGAGAVLSQGGEAELPSLEVDGEVELIVPAERAVLIPATLSDEQRARLSDANLPWLVEPQLVQEVERMHVARGETAGDGSLTICAVDQTWLGGMAARLAEAGIKPLRIVPEPFLADWQAGAWTVVCKPDGGFIRTGAQQALLLDQTRSDQVPAVLRLALRDGGPAAGLRVFTADGAAAPDVAIWENELGVAVRLAGDWLPTGRLSEQAIDLARGPFAPPGRGRDLLRRLRPTLWIAAGILAVNLVGLVVTGSMGFVERQRLRAELEGMLKTAFPQTTTVLDPVLQMRQNVERLGKAAGVPTRGDFLPLLGAVSTALGRQLNGRVEGIVYENGVLVLEFPAAGAAEVDPLRSALATSGLTAKFETLPSAGAAGVRIRLSVSP